MKQKIDQWISDNIEKVTSDGSARDVHVDNFISVSELESRDLIIASVELFNLFINSFSERAREGLILYLSVELIEYGNNIKGAPSTFESLCREFDKLSIPEIVLFKPTSSPYPPPVEIYRKPLSFKEFADYPTIAFFL